MSAARAQRSSGRLLELVPGLPANSLLTYVLAGNGAGQVDMELHSDTDSGLVDGDVDWVFDKIASLEPIPVRDSHMPELNGLATLYELVGVAEPPGLSYGGFELVDQPDPQELRKRANPRYWPVKALTNNMDLLSALTTCEAQVRVHLAPANSLEQSAIGAQLRDSAQLGGAVDTELYLGSPVRIRCFIATSEDRLPPRLRAALLRLGVGLRLEPLTVSDETIAMWNGEETSLAGAAQPFGKAQCLVPIPASGPDSSICGLKTREAQLDVVPLTEAELPGDGLRVGHAIDELGQQVDVRLAVKDLLLHTQVLGATGTGKSSLLAGAVQAAIEAGYGVSVLDAHGPLVERILAELPPEYIGRTIAVQSDDADHPVPVNVLATPDADLILDTMLQVIRDLFDPQNQGIVGPRFERATSQIIKAQQALIGEQANFATVPMWLRDQGTLKAIVDALRHTDPALAQAIASELGNNRSNELPELVAWVNSKFQRLTNSAELRGILLTGADAVDVTRIIDNRQVLLIDLASTKIGTLGAQFLGEMWLLKHWLAMSQRTDVTRPHLIIVDEAQLFGSGILPRMLAESRKYGLGIVMAHQHLQQLGHDLREAALANTSNVVVFRSGPMEAQTALDRLGRWPSGPLTRLPRLTAAATLSMGVAQTQPFTLIVDHNERVLHPDAETGRKVLARTYERYSLPYRNLPQWSNERVDQRLASSIDSRPPQSAFLDEWLVRRKQLAEQANGDGASGATAASSADGSMPTE